VFEFSIIRKYLIPRKRQLSVALIASMSTAVIALVVWLLLVFLSVTDGIEKSWLQKLTALNAPLRITPTDAYYSSYYYLADTASLSSDFSPKSIGQKALALKSDPYDPEIDASLPAHWPAPDKLADGSLKDPVKTAFAILKNLQGGDPSIAFQEFEVSGALLRLQMLRSDSPSPNAYGSQSQRFLTQVSYLASFADQSPYVASLLAPPSAADLNHLFFLAHYNVDQLSSQEIFQSRVRTLLSSADIQKVRTVSSNWRLPPELLAEGTPFEAYAYTKRGVISHIDLIQDRKTLSEDAEKGVLIRQGVTLLFNGNPLPAKTSLFHVGPLSFSAQVVPESVIGSKRLADLRLFLRGTLQGKPISGVASWDGLEIEGAVMKTEFSQKPQELPLWPYKIGSKITLPGLNDRGILVAKSLQNGGVRIGDRGYISYQAATTGSFQEQRIPVYVAGFYDPGVMSIGGKCILVPLSIARTINASSHMQHFDKTASNGIQIWCGNLKETNTLQRTIAEMFEKAGIGQYWKVSTYHEYDFAKDLLQQFQSDRILFTLIGVIILVVACCNIISLLVILVSDKKREIGILQAMGAPPKSIALIFGGLGAAMGIASSILGIGAALLTLHNLDFLVALLSKIQGHDAFNAVFYGQSLPSDLSYDALVFILIATPALSLLAGLVPAIQACRLRPSEILRSE